MTAQLASSTLLAYGPQGARQPATAALLSYSPPAGAQRVVASFSAPWAQSAPLAVETHATMHHAEALDRPTQARWAQGEAREREARTQWPRMSAQDRERSAPWQQFARRLQAHSAQPWVVSREADAQARAPWGEFAGRPALTAVAVWVRAVVSDPQSTAPWGQYTGRPALAMRHTWAAARRADAERWIPWSRFGRPLDAGWGGVTPPRGPPVDENGTVIVLAKRTYIVINEARLRRVDGDIQIPTFTMSMSLDTDSWAWGFSADVPRGALPNLQPSNFGDPVELEAWVNGVPYRFLAEQLSTSRTFGKESLRISGRGLTATLDAPYAPTLNFGNTAARTAQQLMGDVLTVNGVPFGWTVDWQLTDWLVPGSVWTHQGAYVGALNSIVQAAGGYLQPHESDRVVKALLRYPTAPWDWGAAAEFELPADVTTQEGIVWQENPRYNRVFVSGVSAGVLGQVTRAGTDGASIAPMVTDALITHADAARQRGVRELATGGRQALVTLQLPVLETTGVIPPGKMVRYVDGSTTRVGITRSVQVDVRMPEIFQSIEVETYA